MTPGQTFHDERSNESGTVGSSQRHTNSIRHPLTRSQLPYCQLEIGKPRRLLGVRVRIHAFHGGPVYEEKMVSNGEQRYK